MSLMDTTQYRYLPAMFGTRRGAKWKPLIRAEVRALSLYLFLSARKISCHHGMS